MWKWTRLRSCAGFIDTLPSSRSGCVGFKVTVRPPGESMRRTSRWAAAGSTCFGAIDKHGVLIDFMSLERRNTRAAHRSLNKALTTMRNWPPSSITTDKLRSYPEAIERLKRDRKLPSSSKHRTSKYLNNIIEADHGALQQVIRPTRGFQTMKTAIATIKGFEIMRMIRRGHCLTCKRGATNEVRFVNSLFGIAA